MSPGLEFLEQTKVARLQLESDVALMTRRRGQSQLLTTKTNYFNMDDNDVA